MQHIDERGFPVAGGRLDPLAPLPLVSGALPGLQGRIKVEPEDFRVDEIPAYLPSGEGGFLFLEVEKRDVPALELPRILARGLGIDPAEVSTAGSKDRRAVTRQWVSIPAGVALPDLPAAIAPGVLLLSARAHGNRLKTGHLHGNRFRIRVREVPLPADEALARAYAIAATLASQGLPNHFGPQRFGRGGDTGRWGLVALLHGLRALPFRMTRSPSMRRLLLSAGQSLLFNAYLRARMERGLLHTLFAGEVMKKTATGGMFVVEGEHLAEEQARFDAGETLHAGPIFGKKMFAAREQAAAFEAELLADLGVDPGIFAQHGKLADGTRRPNLVRPEGLELGWEDSCLTLSFALPKGAYATGLLAEFLREPLEAPAADDPDEGE